MALKKSDPTNPEFHEFVLGSFVSAILEVDPIELADMNFGPPVKHHNATLYPVTVAGRLFTLMLLDGQLTPAGESEMEKVHG